MSKSFYARCQEPGFVPYQPKFDHQSLRGGTAVMPVRVYPRGVVAVDRCIRSHKLLKLGCSPILGTIQGVAPSTPFGYGSRLFTGMP